MPKSTYFRNAMLELFFKGTAIVDLAENDASTPLTVLWIALHTGDPGLGGTQNSAETTYGGYARQSVSRSSGGFIVTTNTVTFNTQVNFPTVTSGAQTITHFSIGVASSGATPILWSGTVTPNIPVSAAFTPPSLASGTIITEL